MIKYIQRILKHDRLWNHAYLSEYSFKSGKIFPLPFYSLDKYEQYLYTRPYKKALNSILETACRKEKKKRKQLHELNGKTMPQ